MAIGSKRKRDNGDEYVFIDGRAMTAAEAVRIDVSDVAVPGQEQAAQAAVPGAKEVGVKKAKPKDTRKGSLGKAKKSLRDMSESDALELRDDAVETLTGANKLMADDKRKMRRKCLCFGIALVLLVLFSICISHSYVWRINAPGDVIGSIGAWLHLQIVGLSDPNSYEQVRTQALEAYPMMQDVVYSIMETFKYVVCGIMLAVSGMLYQNAFRNPIAAPSMLGVTSGVSVAIVVLVAQFGAQAVSHMGLYYLYAYAGGVIVLVLVMLGGRWIGGKRGFNVVNMLLVGTLVMQLLNVIITYAQSWMSETEWAAYYTLQAATGLDTGWTWLTLIVGLVVAAVPLVLLRFRLNLISFSDAETRLLGVDPNKLRILALACGSIMILTATVNAGQVAMASLVIPFVVRAVFGSEFRKQLAGNILVGAILLLVCGDIVSYVYINAVQLDLGSVVTVLALPLFVWMLAASQRSWE